MAIQSTVEQIKDRISMVDLVGQRVKLTKSGRNFKGLCPFHTEKTPSFYVFPDRDNYHCFGCGQSGDVFTFVMRTENAEFGEALRILAERAGVELQPRGAEKVEDQRRARWIDTMAAATRYFQSMLFASSGEAALAYLLGRGLERSTIETFRLGWAPESWDSLLNRLGEQGYQPEELAEVGLVVAREADAGRTDGRGYYDRFRGRIMFPIRAVDGDVIGFGGRAMGDAQPKYLNSSDSPIFSKGAVLYSLDVARPAIRRDGVAVVVEGYMDALAAHQAGIANVVASMGTALTEEHLLMLKRLAPRLVLALDADEAGDAAALRTLEVLRATYGRIATPVADRRGLVRLRHDQTLDLRVARLPAGKDPDEVIAESPEAFRELVARARPIVEVLIDAEIAKAGDDPHARSLAADNVLDFLKDLPNPVLADQFVRTLADRLGVETEAVRARLARLRRVRRPAARGQAPGAAAAKVDETPTLRDWLTFEEFLLHLMLEHSDRAVEVLPELSSDDFYRSDARAVFELLQQRLSAEGRADPTTRELGAEDGPLAEYAAWIAQWGADLPRLDEDTVARELTRGVRRLRLINHRREIALIAAHRRDRDRESDRTDWEREGARVAELTAEIRAIERGADGKVDGLFVPYWAGLFQEEDRLGIMRTLPKSPARVAPAAEPSEEAKQASA